MPVSNLTLALQADTQALETIPLTRKLTLFDIPTEILHRILVLAAPPISVSIASAIDMLSARQTCGKFKDIFSRVVPLKLELQTDQLGDIKNHLTVHYIKLQHIAAKPKVTSSDLTDQDLTALTLPNTNLEKIKINNSEMSQGHLDKSNLDMSTITETNMKFMTFNDAKARNATWTNVKFQGADAQNSFFTGSTLKGFKAQYADLRSANFKSTKMADAQLHGADLRGADLRNANLEKAELTGAIMDSMTRLESTKLPQNFNIQSHLLTREELSQHQINKEIFFDENAYKNFLIRELKSSAIITTAPTTPVIADVTQPINIPMRSVTI